MIFKKLPNEFLYAGTELMKKKVLIIGGGGHAKVLIESLKSQKIEIYGILEKNPSLIGKKISGISVFEEKEMLLTHPPSQTVLVNGIGSTATTNQREEVFTTYKRLRYDFLSIIHSTAYIASDVHIGEGLQAMAGSIIQCGSTIGDNVIINTHSSIDHDCEIGHYTHVAPGVTVSGNVKIGIYCHIGTGASIIQGIQIGKCALIAAGSVVIRDIRENQKVCGVPAKEYN